MNLSRVHFLELARCGLWGSEPNLSIFEGGINWTEVLQIAKQQTLVGVVSVAIERLPPSMRPTRQAALRLHQMVSLNRQFRAHQVVVLGKILSLIKESGVERPVLLKGLGLGLNYSDPTLRQCGDLDIYIEQKMYDSCCDYLAKLLNIDRNDEVEDDHHFAFFYLDTHIEIHQCAVAARSVVYRSGEFVEWCTRELEGENLVELEIDGVKFFTPPHSFNFIYVFYHTWWHFLSGGVGLRQFCDWCRFVATHSEVVDVAEIKRNISLFKLDLPMAIFSTIAVEDLGLSAESYPGYSPVSDKLRQGAMDIIWRGGNFGKYDPAMARRKEGFFKRKVWGALASFQDVGYISTLGLGFALKLYSMLLTFRVKMAIRDFFLKTRKS